MVKVVYEKYEYVDKKSGEVRQGKNYSIVLENGYRVPIRPVFKEGYSPLLCVAVELKEDN